MDTPQAKKKQRMGWALPVGAVVAALAIAISAAPAVASSNWGKEQISKAISSRLNGKVHIDALSLSWFSGQQVNGITVTGWDGSQIAKVDSATSEASLLSLLFGSVPGAATLKGAELDLLPYADGTTNLDVLLKRAEPAARTSLPPIKLFDMAAETVNSPALALTLNGKTLADSTEGSFDVVVGSKPGTQEISVKVNVRQFPVLVLDQLATIKNPKLKGSLLALLGDTLNITVNQTLDTNKKGGESALYNMLLEIVSDKARINLQSTPHRDNTQVSLSLQMPGIQATPLLLNIDERISLAQPATIQIALDSEPLERLAGSALPFRWQASSPAQLVISDFKSQYPQDEVLSSSLQAALQIQDVVLLSMPGVGDVEIIQATLEADSPELKASAFKLSALVRVVEPEGVMKQLASQPFKLDLTGKGYLKDTGAFSIEDVSLKLGNDLVSMHLQGRLTEDKALVMTSPAEVRWSGEAGGLTLTIAPLEISLSDPQLNTLKATLRTDAHKDELIALEWNTNTHTFLANGAFDEFPVGKVSADLAAIFGPSISGSMLVQIKNEKSGPVRVVLKGAYGSISLDGRYEDGVLRLNKALEGQVQATPQLSSVVLQRFMPLLAGLVSADAPITFKVEADNFALPIYPFLPEKGNVGLATVNFGQVQFRNGGPLAKALSVLRPGKNDLLSLWFTPLYLHMQRGVVSLERVDVLLQGRYPLAAWGNIDIANKVVDMQIGLSAITIAHAFNVKIGDPSLYIAVPFRGSLSDPSIDKASATAQITSLVAQTQAGTPGMILGTVLQIASTGSPVTGANVPPPTTSPLPWDGQLQMEETRDSPGEAVSVPVKAVSEGAGKLLKNLFR